MYKWECPHCGYTCSLPAFRIRHQLFCKPVDEQRYSKYCEFRRRLGRLKTQPEYQDITELLLSLRRNGDLPNTNHGIVCRVGFSNRKPASSKWSHQHKWYVGSLVPSCAVLLTDKVDVCHPTDDPYWHEQLEEASSVKIKTVFRRVNQEN